jgi:hypothetical protein
VRLALAVERGDLAEVHAQGEHPSADAGRPRARGDLNAHPRTDLVERVAADAPAEHLADERGLGRLDEELQVFALLSVPATVPERGAALRVEALLSHLGAASDGALADPRVLLFGDGGHDGRGEPARGRRRIEALREAEEAHAAGCEVGRDVEEVERRPGEPVLLRDDDDVTGASVVEQRAEVAAFAQVLGTGAFDFDVEDRRREAGAGAIALDLVALGGEGSAISLLPAG